MNDIRRTILWVIFGFSMVLLWDQWQVHNGQKATFFPTPGKPATSASAPGVAASGVPVASALPSASNATPGTAQVPGQAGATAAPVAAVPRERIVV